MCATPIVRRMQRMHWHLLHYYNKEMQYQVTGVMVTITTQHILRDLDVWVRPGQVPGTVVTMGWSRVCQYTCFYVSELLGQWVLGKSSVPSLCWYPDPVSAITTGHMSYHEEISCFESEKFKNIFIFKLSDHWTHSNFEIWNFGIKNGWMCFACILELTSSLC